MTPRLLASPYQLTPAVSHTLHLARAASAQAVVLGHALSFLDMWPRAQPPFVPHMQNLGVVIFFVLSGFLIMHTIARRQANGPYAFGSFVFDRFTRIYAGLVPALVVVVLLDVLLWPALGLDLPQSYSQALNVRHFFANLLMLQDFRTMQSTRPHLGRPEFFGQSQSNGGFMLRSVGYYCQVDLSGPQH